MDTNKLLHFKMVYQTGNLREAAELLGISHAGLSKSIKSLEADLGIELITKDGRGIKTTPAGSKILNQIDETLASVNNLREKASGINSVKSSFCKIGTFEVFSTYLIPEIIKALPKDINIVLKEHIPGKLEEEIINGNIDFGISYLAIPSKELDHMKISKIKMGVYGHKKFNKLNFEELPFVTPVANIEGTPTKVKGLDGWPEHRHPRKIKYNVSLLESALSLTREGLAVGHFPRFIVERHNQIVAKAFQIQEVKIPLKIQQQQDIYLIKRKDSNEDILAKKISKVLRSLQ